ncbi:MAG: hypothetical protein LBC45_02760 [Chlamydiales bacterium]|jgi:hypothetical protein|nr:hypothetical protein [Chlamydiales bacterium]
MTKIFLGPSVQVPEIKHVSLEKISVHQKGFYDLGFDPDFSVDGNIFYKKQSSYKEQPSFNLFHSLIKTVYNFIKYFLQTPEKRAFQELIEIEKIWQKAAQAEGMLYPEDLKDESKNFWQRKAPCIYELKQNQFFKQLSKIASIDASVKEVYSSELLKPVHSFNRPQNPFPSKEDIFKQKDGKVYSQDVARLGKWGFILLNNHGEHCILHKNFLESIDESGKQLKLSIRELRLTIRKRNYEEFNEKLKVFKQSWNQYVKSHPLLEELSIVYSKEDFFEESHRILENLYREMQNPNVYREKDVLTIVNNVFTIEGPQQEEKCSKKLYEVFLSKFPNSDTAKKISEDQKNRTDLI